MTDEIFDYFGGKSPRKVEPLKSDDFFDDLLTNDNPESAEEPGDEQLQADADQTLEHEPDIPTVVFEAVEEPAEPVAVEPSVDVDNEPEDEEDSVDESETHWDQLAFSLGLQSTPPIQKSKKSKSKAKSRAKTQEKQEVKKQEKSADETEYVRDEIVEPIEAEIVEASSPVGEPESSRVLSELFVPRDEEEFESPSDAEIVAFQDPADEETVEVIRDDDPFAAFHRRPDPGHGEESIGDEAGEITDEDELSSLVVTDDFVEFDVKDLGGDRAKSGSRPRRGNRKEKSRETRKNEARDGREQRQPRQHRESRKSETRDGNEPTRDRHGRQKKKSDRDRGSKKRGRKPVESSSSSGNEEGRRKKKPKVPTWEDAIWGVVEKNIRRHKSNKSENRRGGKRRR